MTQLAALSTKPLESALQAIESAWGVTLTVRDLTGALTAAGVDPARNSHRRQPVCDRGFDQRCIDHCRHYAGQVCQHDTQIYRHRCWKGVCELLLPLKRHGVFIGYLFAGAWRDGAPIAGPWTAAWQALPPWDETRATALMSLLSLVAEALVQRSPHQSTTRADHIIDWVRAHLTESQVRQGLARHLHLSPSRTSHVVRAELGHSLETVVMQERLAAACALLTNSDLSIATIGERVGWRDPPHFTRMFRRLTGCSPGRWRARHAVA